MQQQAIDKLRKQFPHASSIGKGYKDRISKLNPIEQAQVLAIIATAGEVSAGPRALEFISDITGEMADGMRSDGLAESAFERGAV